MAKDKSLHADDRKKSSSKIQFSRYPGRVSLSSYVYVGTCKCRKWPVPMTGTTCRGWGCKNTDVSNAGWAENAGARYQSALNLKAAVNTGFHLCLLLYVYDLYARTETLELKMSKN